MDAKPNYFRLGLFVLAALALIVVAVILFGAGLFVQNRLRIESYFQESITGLSVGSPVELRGVRIGQVEEIGFVGSVYKPDPNAPGDARYASWVRVVSGVLRSKLPEPGYPQIGALLERMVARGLRVRVSSNLLTQQAYLEVNFADPNRFPVQPVPWVPKYPVIPSAPNEFTTIKDSIDKILTQLQEVDAPSLAVSLKKLFASMDTAISQADVARLSEEAYDLLQAGRQKVDALDMAGINARIERVLTSLNQAVAEANVPALSGNAQTLIAELRKTNEYLQTLLAPPPGVTPSPNVPEVVARLNEVVGNLNSLITTERPGIERVLNDLRAITDSLRELVASLEQNPSQLLFSRPPKKPGVVK
jgi:ABC-type transporter Mla subunit MlaD